MIELAPNQFQLSDDEQEMIDILKEDMGLSSRQEVLNLLVRQAVQRVAITCPNCGHYARRTAADEARCRSCFSVITLTEGIWESGQVMEE
ncbi:MAG: hypothetical protein D6775_08995 [Caldilineae bacterium]|nr:MAG: hypothetical protein D6775_08995 [Caldilineae bacterium]